MDSPFIHAEELLRRHGRSFYLAARFLPHAACERATRLYAFCRLLDDIADAAGDPERAKQCLFELREDLKTSQQSLARIYASIELSNDLPAQALLLALAEDTGPRQIQNCDELIRYCYGVAGTVGLMMADILAASCDSALSHALDLGIAMQLVNISRDVQDDAERERIYVPAEWLPAKVGAAELREAPMLAWDAVQRTLQTAESYFDSGFQGLRFLPKDCQRGIWMAGRVYQEIGKEILRRGPRSLLRRTVVPRWRKIAIGLSCRLTPLKQAPFGPIFPTQHNGKLHHSMAGLFGTDLTR